MIDAKWNRKHFACYGDDQLRELYDRKMTIWEVLTRKDGNWSGVPNNDRIWVLTRPGVFTKKQRNEWLARLVERALGRIKNPDPRFVAVIGALRSGRVTKKIVDAAYAAANIAAAYAAANAANAAYAAADAAYAAFAAAFAADAANAAANTQAEAAKATERERQIQDALEILSP